MFGHVADIAVFRIAPAEIGGGDSSHLCDDFCELRASNPQHTFIAVCKRPAGQKDGCARGILWREHSKQLTYKSDLYCFLGGCAYCLASLHESAHDLRAC